MFFDLGKIFSCTPNLPKSTTSLAHLHWHVTHSIPFVILNVPLFLEVERESQVWTRSIQISGPK
jgi:hypothetical protein